MEHSEKILVKGKETLVTLKTIEMNYYREEEFYQMSEQFGDTEPFPYHSLKHYIDLLKEGKATLLDPTLGATFPAIHFKDNPEDLHKVIAFCTQNQIPFKKVDIEYR
ncbi:hypothetical protein [Aquimarina mytili]|uniref:Uncharacterized protein n=1 Tax=Aquimarina mytili TaxID=874423 RepID=A0A936ZUZ6_9FLAO|nr:hypothetical protein [Aquimarina mytili]MBL0686084.1 hypothetical protein [Aquimarina mytili]